MFPSTYFLFSWWQCHFLLRFQIFNSWICHQHQFSEPAAQHAPTHTFLCQHFGWRPYGFFVINSYWVLSIWHFDGQKLSWIWPKSPNGHEGHTCQKTRVRAQFDWAVTGEHGGQSNVEGCVYTAFLTATHEICQPASVREGSGAQMYCGYVHHEAKVLVRSFTGVLVDLHKDSDVVFVSSWFIIISCCVQVDKSLFPALVQSSIGRTNFTISHIVTVVLLYCCPVFYIWPCVVD